MIERRKHRRFRVKNRAFAALRPYYLKIGHIIDVSMGGLAFLYLADSRPQDASSALEILSAGDDLCLSDLPFKTIADIENGGRPFSPVKARRCGLQFGHLMPDQISKLTFFIEKYRIDEE